MKLVYVHFWGDYDASGEDHICFDYPSKEMFVYDVLEKFKDKVWNNHKVLGETYYEKVSLFDHDESVKVDQNDVEGIEHNVYTLEEWWKLNKIDYELVKKPTINKVTEFFQK